MRTWKFLLLAALLGAAATTASGNPRANDDRSEVAARSVARNTGEITYPNIVATEPTPDRTSICMATAAARIAPHSAWREIEECADAVERFCTKTGSSGEAVEISNYTCWGVCTSGRAVRVFCA